MKFLADESCDFAIVKGLRSAGYDVEAIIEEKPGALDSEVLRIAVERDRILLTEDKDFGEWVFAHKSATAGVVFIRYPSKMRSGMIEVVVELVNQYGEELFGRFIVLEPGRARIRNIAKT